jgi:hypothetical protein
LSNIKTYDVELIIEFNKEELIKYQKENPSKVIKINRYIQSLSAYLKENPEATIIRVSRRILKQINKHTLLIDSPFPYPTFSEKMEINLIKQKTSEIENSFSLTVYGDYVFCYRCEFLTYYSPGDTLFIVFLSFKQYRKMAGFLKE